MKNDHPFHDKNFFFDLHCHPTTKSFLCDGFWNPWQRIGKINETTTLPIIGSQSCLSQLHEGNVCIGVYTAAALELGYSSHWFVSDVLSKLPNLSNRLLKAINTGRLSYNQLLKNELELLGKFLKDPGSSRNVQLLEFFPTTEETIEKMNTGFYGIMAIEGSHALYNRVDETCSILENLSKIKHQAKFSFLYLTLTHLAWNSAANQAYNNKFIKDRVFKPVKKGIGDHGYQIIDACYSNSNETYLEQYKLCDNDAINYSSGKRILIDVKHMSAYARVQFYRHREDQGQAHIPILATHVGVTGFARKNLADQIIDIGVCDSAKDKDLVLVNYKDVKGIGKTKFFPWSVNLYDEEIDKIVQSEGLIGLNMDRRILGLKKNLDEFWLREELEVFVGDDLIRKNITREEEQELEDVIIMDYVYYADDEEKANEGDKDLDWFINKHCYHLCNNLLHIFKVGVKADPTKSAKEMGRHYWRHVCMGSDFDGLINPIRNCKSAKDYPKLQKDMFECLPKLMDMDTYKYPAFTEEELIDIIRGFMYKNAIAFLKKYFTEEFLTKNCQPT